MLNVSINPDFDSWRATARMLLIRNIPADQIVWTDARSNSLLLPQLFEPHAIEISPGRLPRVPPTFLSLAKTVCMHRDGDRWSLLYRVLWRLNHGEPNVLNITVDDDVDHVLRMEKLVRRDIHKMHAFVRFRLVEDAFGEHYIAWHRPDHFIVPAIGPWFAQRFPVMRWSILTPDTSVAWDGDELRYGPGVPASAAPQGDVLEELWKTYYASIFNPARIKIGAMKKEMPVRHWATLPETELIESLIKKAAPRVEVMMQKSKSKLNELSAAAFVPKSLELPVLAKAATQCKGCELYCHATQVVFGEGPTTASVMFVGEQPGDKEDLAGKPFIGPAGKMFDQGLFDAGVDRGNVYVTNAVKHFKFEQRGTRRIHSKPSSREMSACRPWLEAEIKAVQPKLIVCLGATAAQTLMGPQFRITRDRGKIITDQDWAPAMLATNHPSAILRVPNPEARDAAYEAFVQDLKIVACELRKLGKQSGDVPG